MSRATALARLLRPGALPYWPDAVLTFRRLDPPFLPPSIFHRTFAASRPSNPKITRKPGTAASATAASDTSTSTAPTLGPASNEPMPRSARYLGLAGTIPFFSCAGVAVFMPDAANAAATVAQMYGASVLSFLGAVHWGIALRTAGGKTRDWDFAYSVCPSLAAAAAAVLPTDTGLTTLLASFGAALVYDASRFAGEPGIPEWYPKLRKPLTAAAMVGTGVCLGVVWESHTTEPGQGAPLRTSVTTAA